MAGCFGKRKNKDKKKSLKSNPANGSSGFISQQPLPPEYKVTSANKSETQTFYRDNGRKSSKTPERSRPKSTEINLTFLDSPNQQKTTKTDAQPDQRYSEARQVKSPGKSSKSQQFVNIGIYLDESHIFVGTTDPERIQPKLLVQHPGQLTLLEDRAEIGKNVSTARVKYTFSLYDLLKDEANSAYDIKFDKIEVSVSPEELLVTFFKNLVVQIRANTKDGAVGNVIVTTAFLLTSFEKQRLKFAMTAANIIPTRILTSLLTTAIAEATYNRSYTPAKNDQEFVVVVHSTENSFSMAVIEIGKDYISTRRCVGSENYELPFNKKNASSLYEIGLNDLRIEEYGCQKIMEVSKLEPVPLVGRTSFGGYMSVSSVGVFEGPFAGACFLACSAFMPQLKLPSNINVQGASRSDIAVYLKGWRNPRQIPFRNTIFIRRTVFQDRVSVPAEGSTMTLYEEYLESVSIQMGLFRIEGSEWSNEAFVQVLVDQDGIFTITSKDANVVRLNGFSGTTSGRPSQVKRLWEYYNTLSKGSSNKGKTDVYEITSQINGMQTAEGKRQNAGITPSLSGFVHADPPAQKIKDVLDTAGGECLKQYKNLMLELTDRREPFTQSQICQHHENSKAEVLQAFKMSFASLLQTDPLPFLSAKKKLQQEMQSQFPILVRRYEVTIEKVATEKHLATLKS